MAVENRITVDFLFWVANYILIKKTVRLKVRITRRNYISSVYSQVEWLTARAFSCTFPPTKKTQFVCLSVFLLCLIVRMGKIRGLMRAIEREEKRLCVFRADLEHVFRICKWKRAPRAQSAVWEPLYIQGCRQSLTSKIDYSVSATSIIAALKWHHQIVSFVWARSLSLYK